MNIVEMKIRFLRTISDVTAEQFYNSPRSNNGRAQEMTSIIIEEGEEGVMDGSTVKITREDGDYYPSFESLIEGKDYEVIPEGGRHKRKSRKSKKSKKSKKTRRSYA
jgi:hypothetical protein